MSYLSNTCCSSVYWVLDAQDPEVERETALGGHSHFKMGKPNESNAENYLRLSLSVRWLLSCHLMVRKESERKVSRCKRPEAQRDKLVSFEDQQGDERIAGAEWRWGPEIRKWTWHRGVMQHLVNHGEREYGFCSSTDEVLARQGPPSGPWLSLRGQAIVGTDLCSQISIIHHLTIWEVFVEFWASVDFCV